MWSLSKGTWAAQWERSTPFSGRVREGFVEEVTLNRGSWRMTRAFQPVQGGKEWDIFLKWWRKQLPYHPDIDLFRCFNASGYNKTLSDRVWERDSKHLLWPQRCKKPLRRPKKQGQGGRWDNVFKHKQKEKEFKFSVKAMGNEESLEK